MNRILTSRANNSISEFLEKEINIDTRLLFFFNTFFLKNYHSLVYLEEGMSMMTLISKIKKLNKELISRIKEKTV